MNNDEERRRDCDDILAGLACHKQFIYECDRCPYFDDEIDSDTLCVERLHRDAYALIQGLRSHQTDNHL